MPSPFELFRVRIKQEAVPGTDPGGWSDSYNIRCERPEVKPAAKLLEEAYYRPHDAEFGGVTSVRSESEVSLKCRMDGWKKGPASGDYPPTTYWLTHLLDQVFYGRYSSGAATTVSVAPGDPDYNTVKFANSANFKPGQIVAIQSASTGKWYAVQLQSSDSGSPPEWVIMPDLAGCEIDVGDAVYTSHTWYFLEDIGNVKHVSVQIDTHSHRMTISGCHVASASLNWETGEQAKIDLNLKGMRWEKDDSALLYAASDVAVAPVVSSAKIVLAETTAESHGSTYSAYGLSVDFGLNVAKIQDDNDEDGLSGWHQAGIRKPRVKLNVRLDPSFFTEYTERTEYSFLYQLGNEPGKMWGIYIPAAVLEEMPVEANLEGFQGQTLVLKPVAHDRHTPLSGASWSHPHNKTIYMFLV